MRIVYLSIILLSLSPLLGAETAQPEQPTWQDIVRSTQDRKSAEAPEPEPETNTLYKVVNENGVPSFTDVAPADEDSERFEVEKEPSLNVLGGKSDKRKQYENKLTQKIKYREQQAAKRKKNIQRAKEALEQAKKLQQEGSAPAVGDWQNTNKGRRFLKESYYARQQQLEQGVGRAEKRLQDLQR